MDDANARDASPEVEETTIILAAVDTSPLSSQVVEVAARIARRTWPNAQLHLVHVFRTSRFDRPSSAGFNRDELTGEARSYLEHHLAYARRQATVPVTGHFTEGDPTEQIVKTARQISADLLIVGTGDSAGLERFLIGSVAAKVAKKAPCSVFVVRRKQRPYVKVGPPETTRLK
jgi:nucleotide-binding universal stress UspA family protein